MKGTVRPMTPGQREQLAARIIPGDLTFDEAQAIIEAPKTSEFDTKVAAAFAAKRIIVPGHFPVWRTIKVGTFKTPAKLDAAIENADCRISDWARDLMTRPEFTLAGKQEDVELVKVTVGELGFAKATPLSKIRDRGVELGLELCQPEDGPQLRCQYPDQPNGEVVWMAMNSITGSGSHPRIFHVHRDAHDRWLDTHWGHPDSLWYPDHAFVFRKKKQIGS